MGELTVWVEQGPKATVAAVIRGNAPQDLRLSLQDTLEQIHREARPALESFDGDASAFDASRGLLEACLQEARRSGEPEAKPEKKPRTREQVFFRKFVLWTVVGGLSLAAAAGYAVRAEENAQWSAFVDRLNSEPGVVTTSAEQRGGEYVVRGLRDPLAQDPASIARQVGLDAGRLSSTWEPYQALAPAFVLARAKAAPAPPPGVALRLDGTVLHAAGRRRRRGRRRPGNWRR